MEKWSTKKIWLLAIVVFSTFTVSAQDFEEILAENQTAGENYLQNYLNPFFISMGNGLANGWTNTAQPHKLFGFDATVTLSVATIPDTDFSFLFQEDPNRYPGFTVQGSATEMLVPTFAGGDHTGPDIIYDENGPNEVAISPLNGLGLNDFDIPLFKPGVPVPMANVGVGLPKNTELRVRFLPVNDLGDELGINKSFGLGVLHDIKQWIPGMKLVPMDIAAFIGFTNFEVAYEDPDTGDAASLRSSATTFQVLVSKKLLFFTPYASLGFNAVKSEFNFSTDGIDPVNLEFSGNGGARFKVGARFKILWVLSLHADYTFQKYNAFTAGFGINIR